MKLVKQSIKIMALKKLAASRFGTLVKAVVDINRKIMAVGGEMHADEEKLLIERGSKQADLWGINLYPEKFNQAGFVEFDSIINLRPVQNNFSRGVEDKKIQTAIIRIINYLVKP